MDEHTIEVAGTPVFYRSAPVPSDVATPLYLHGAPTSSDDWGALVSRTGGVAPDLLGFGRSGKGGHLDYTIAGLTSFIERLLFELEIERVSLVGHEWGAAVGLSLAERRPELVERMVLVNAVPLLEGFQWHRLGRLLRRPLVGELIMGSTPQWLLARVLRSGCADPATFGDERVRAVWEQFDQGTQRAMLRLYRTYDEDELTVAGAGLGALGMPMLVVWGEMDPWYPAEWADRYGERLPNAEVIRIADAGHWPWLESPEVIDLVTDFVRG